jgi:putative CocE/NonD family hydrolase
MRIVSDLPRTVRVIDNTWIPMSDGSRLAAKIWLPEDAQQHAVPAVLEALPYRKDDGTVIRDELRYPYLAGHGYAGVRLDLRGSGDSDGVLEDEYSERELLDIEEVVAWVAEQDWCTGAVGMWGISWGGFNALQVAARRPAALKAIITMMSADDRYLEDVHYRGGTVLGLDMLHWSTYMLAANAQPPDPAVVGDRWRELWEERLAANEPLVSKWLAHQRRDDYWKHGSVSVDYAAIECAVYAIGGWQDGYTNTVPRLLQHMTCPRRGLIGPWGHRFPESGSPGPAVGGLQDAVRWWDQWLKGEETGIMDEPMLQAFVQDSVRPQVTYEQRPGRFVGAEQWPPADVEVRSLALNDGTVDERPEAEVQRRILGRQTCGMEAAGPWCGEGETADDPDDQRRDDGESLVFDSQPLDDDLAILGFPKVTLQLASDQPVALVCVRLCEVFPDGASKLVTRGVLNLTHRDSHDEPSPLEPGRRYAVRVELDVIGHVFARGNRIRVAVSPTYWPWAWPSPRAATLTVFTGGESALELPELPLGWPDPPRFEEPVSSPPLPYERVRTGMTSRVFTRDMHTGHAELRFLWDSGNEYTLPNGMRMRFDNDCVYSIVEGDPLSARVLVSMMLEYSRDADGWSVRIDARAEMSCDARRYLVDSTLTAVEVGGEAQEWTWRHEFPRDLA